MLPGHSMMRPTVDACWHTSLQQLTRFSLHSSLTSRTWGQLAPTYCRYMRSSLQQCGKGILLVELPWPYYRPHR
jgi:hypothetical protein